MSTSFNVNKADLEFILKQIQLAEATSLAYTATPKTILQAIMDAYGVTAADAALLPYGLRTVDGSDNNLLPGQTEFGAADTLFPRLTNPVFLNDQDGDQMPLGPGAPIITNTNYDPTIPGSHSVADADPRIISNLIVDMTAANPAAVEAALKYSVFTGAIAEGDIPAAAADIAQAYALTQSTRAAAAPDNIALLAGIVAAETAQQADAQDAHATAQTDYNAALAADTYRVSAQLAAASDNAAAAVVTAINVVGSAIFSATVGAEDLTNAQAAVDAAQAALDAATAVRIALAGLTEEPAAQTVVTNASALLNALVVYQSGLTLDGDSDGSTTDVDSTDLAALLLAGTMAADYVAGAQALTDSLNLLVDNLPGQEGDVANALAALNTAAGLLTTADAELATAQANLAAASDPATVAAADTALNAILDSYGIGHDPLGSLVIPNLSPDIGLSPGFNSWMTFFGQFFDHGLDLVTKGNAGTVFIPLQADDPLIAGQDGIFGTTDDLPAHLRFMALTRATVTIDANGVPQHENTTTPFIDQNQTYTSHASHQVFLREYVRVGNETLATGRLLDGSTASGSLDGAIGNWGEVKAQALTMLGIRLSDFDVHNVPLLATDQYGKLILGPNGYAQVATLSGLVEGTAAGLELPADTIRTGHAFLNDIAHHAAPGSFDPDGPGGPAPAVQQTADIDIDANGNGVYDEGIDTLTDVNGDGAITTADFFADDHSNATYDDEMLNSHFITGDGRGNENIALSATHSVFHSEHNRIVEANKATIIASGDVAFLNEWLRVDVATTLTAAEVQALNPADLQWDGERLFQAARFSTEMQYQHLVFEEFARRIQPMVDPFVFTPTPNIDPSIVAEFAHTVYRFGHSMLTGTVDRLENDLTTVNGELDQQGLLAAFLNPQMFAASGSVTNTNSEALANIVRGTSRDVGNEIDEFVVEDLRSNLVGLPLDLAALNIARGRDTGIPSLNETRAQLYTAGALDLIPYTSWNDFAQNIKNPLSVVNFIAAYGTHASLTSAATTAEMRDAAMLLVFGDGDNTDGVTIRGVTYSNQDRLDFLNGAGAYTADKGGMDLVDLWIGGLAERKNEFGGMLGQTFNYIFEYQMEQLQFGDRFYYLSRTQGQNLLNQLEPNTFADLVMRNSELGGIYATHLNGQLFVTPDFVLELDRGIAQEDYNGIEPALDPLWEGPLPAGVTAKVVRDYTGSTIVDGTHDFGGKLTFLGGEHVVVGGTEGNDVIRTDKGIDTIWGDGGNDYINAGMESDDVFGGEGDDVIEDPFGDDVLRGQQGNDVITSARGFDLLFGGEGRDYIQIGQDASEAFAGSGDDFILGGAGVDFLLGNEGNDWIEGGAGFDTLAGDNAEVFFNSLIIGHDVLMGQGDESDYDGESGDDIMVSAGGTVQRMEGMFGFDWAAAKNDVGPVDFDFSLPFFTSIPADILRDRFNLVEAASGWQFDDKLTGDNRGTLFEEEVLLGVDPLFNNNVLDAAGIARIDGLGALINPALATLGFVDTFRDGNILLGGDGSDTLTGRGGNDILDGDAWLNVRIKIVIATGPNVGTYSAESLNTDTSAAGPYAGLVFNTNPDGSPDFTSPAFGGRTLQSLLLDRTINPGDMSIVREILQSNSLLGADPYIDTAVFMGNLAEYEIEGVADINFNGVLDVADLAVAGNGPQDTDGDGFLSVRDLAADRPVPVDPITGLPLFNGPILDGRDLLKHIEVLRFADGEIQIGPEGLSLPEMTFTAVRPESDITLPASGAVIGNLGIVNAPVAVTFSLISGDAPVTVTPEGVVTLTGDLPTNSILTLIVRASAANDPGAFIDQTITIRTGTDGVDTLDGDGLIDVIYALAGDDVVNGGGGRDSLFGQAGNDELNGGLGNDSLTGGEGDDLVNGEDGNDTFHYRIGDGIDTMEGGAGIDTVNITDAAGIDSTLDVLYDGGLTTVEDGATFNIEVVHADLGDGVNTLSYAGSGAGVTVFLADGDAPAVIASGFDSLRHVVNVTGTDTDDILSGNSDVNTLIGLGGNDLFVATVDDVSDVIDGGNQDDTADYSAYTQGLTVNLGAAAPIVVGGSGSTDANSDVLVSIENVTGGSGNDTITGNTVDNILNGGDGDDTLFGQAGNDELNGGLGNDSLTGGAENDIVNGGDGNDTIHYRIGDGVDTMDGGAEIDTVNITDAAGNDGTLNVSYDGGLTAVEGGAIFNIEVVHADLGDGVNTLSYAGSGAGVTVDLAAGTASGFTQVSNVQNVIGTSMDDILSGDSNANSLSGSTGNDILNGGAGNDELIGGAGNDTIRYTIGDGIDTVIDGGADTDTVDILANGGDDTLTVTYDGTTITTFVGNSALTSIERFTANLGAGNDTLVYTNATGVTADLGAGTASGFASIAGIENVTGGTGADTFIAGVNDVRNTLNGAGGTDTADYAAYTANLTVNLGGTAPIVVVGSGSTTANSDVLVAIENFTGGTGIDSITGNSADNILNGGAGNDTINYVIGGGADTVDGGAGTDTLNITDGNGNNILDVIYNGTVITSVEGGAISNIEIVNANMGGAADTLSYTGSTASVTVNLADGTASGTASGFNQLISVLHVTGTAQADSLSGNRGANTLIGGAGNDTFNYVMGGGADTVDGGADIDTLNITETGGIASTLDVLYNGTVLTSIEGGTISNIEIVNADLGGNADRLSYAGSTAGVTVDLEAGPSGTASGFTQLFNVEHVTGTAQADNLSGHLGTNTLDGGDGDDTLNGEEGSDTLNGDGGNDSLNGGAGADILVGGAGADQINTGAADDNVLDRIRFSAANEFGDTITNFDATGTVDRIEFGGALNTAWDDRTLDDNVQFSSGNGTSGAITVNMTTTVEALRLTGANGEGVTTANLGNAALVAAAFNAEFAITAANGEDALLVINDTDGNSASVWQWIQNTAVAGNTAEVDANELTLIGVITANGTVGTASFDFF